MQPVVFTFADELNRATRFCTTISRARMADFIPRKMIPRPEDQTATVTFIEYEGRAYAVTAWHVVTFFKCQAKKEGIESEDYFLPARPGKVLRSPFIQPLPFYPDQHPDVGIMPIPADLPAAIGKEVYRFTDQELLDPVPYALAAGFPTDAKYLIETGEIVLPGVILAAGGVGSHKDSDQMQFDSDVIDNEGNRTRFEGNVSGISGGPVFWSDGNRHGLLGFVKQCAESTKDGSRERVNIICQRTTYAKFARWVSYVDREHAKRRQVA